jgi:glycine/D-amino acid oxidase-like deaminating enzyme
MAGYQEDERFLDAIADAEPYPYWMEDVDEPDSNPMLVRDDSCDLCIVGGGYTGLWTAILAKERNPSADVILIDSHEVGSAASGRNGGFMDSSLTHGIANAQQRVPKEGGLLEDLGLENLNQIEAAIRRYNIDCDFERNGVIEIASTRHAGNYLEEMREDYEQLLELGHKVEWLDQQAVQREVASPIFTGGMWCKDTAALVDPARLVWGLKSAAESLGVRIYEDTRATGLD